MLKPNRITLESTEKTHRMEDVSSHFLDTDFINIHGDGESLMLRLARLLAGLYKLCSDSMVYREEVMEYFTPQEQCRYRSVCTTFLFCDFQLLEQRSVPDNICMSYDEGEQELDDLLRQQGLYGKKETWIKDLGFDDYIRTVLLYILLHHSRVLVAYPPSSPFSTREWERMFPLLKELSASLLVMVVQDENSYSWSDRIIEFEVGYVISDSCGQGSAYPRQSVSRTQSQLQPRIVKRMQT